MFQKIKLIVLFSTRDSICFLPPELINTELYLKQLWTVFNSQRKVFNFSRICLKSVQNILQVQSFSLLEIWFSSPRFSATEGSDIEKRDESV